jgi:hypothetical protein
VNAHADARAVARLSGVLACRGAPLLRPGTLARATAQGCEGPDVVTGLPGAGGSVGFADLEARLGPGHTPNRMGAGLDLRDPRTIALVDAAHASL